jgi:hypothetical protein
MFRPSGCPHCYANPELTEGQPDRPLVGGNVASQLTRLQPFDYFMWSIVEREVNKCPHITLASLKDKISDVMTNLDREVVIQACKKFWYCIGATGVFIK